MTSKKIQAVHVIGGGLAGSEVAWQLAQRGIVVVLHEMRPLRATPVHKTDGYAELVCSNSFRSDDREHNAVGLLHEEMRRLGSLIMRAADTNQVPAGGALAVDRDGFSGAVSSALANHPLIALERGEVVLPPDEWDSVIVATGPLTSPDLAAAIVKLTGEQQLAFFDAIAPVVHRDSIDLTQAWFQSRYDKAGPGGTGADYINCPLSREQYELFVAGEQFADKLFILLARQRTVDVVSACPPGPRFIVARLEPGLRHVNAVAMDDRGNGVEESELLLTGQPYDRSGKIGRGQGAGCDDDAVPLVRRQDNLSSLKCDQRVVGKCR